MEPQQQQHLTLEYPAALLSLRLNISMPVSVLKGKRPTLAGCLTTSAQRLHGKQRHLSGVSETFLENPGHFPECLKPSWMIQDTFRCV